MESQSSCYSKLAADGLSTALLAADSSNSSSRMSADSTLYTTGPRSTRSGTAASTVPALSIHENDRTKYDPKVSKDDLDGEEDDEEEGGATHATALVSKEAKSRPHAIL